ncbi:MAG: DUF763 domain-containing protein [Myxococcota bacterium]
MGRSTGIADLPLHGGRVPEWLADRMARLGRVMVEAMVLQYGRQEVLRRLAHPFWFQSLGCVMGMDWHSSGITTSVVGALKRGLAPVEWELGLHVCGGRGRHSRATPQELRRLSERLGHDGATLQRTSRLVAKVDSAAVQDGFDIYLHSFILADDGHWVVVQQGMNTGIRQARRYHWLSEGLDSFVNEPHAAIDGLSQGQIVNLTDKRAEASRRAQVELVNEGPDVILEQLQRGAWRPGSAPHAQLPAHHDVRASDVFGRRLAAALAAAADAGPRDFTELLLTPGVGARTVMALAHVAEVIHGAPSRFTDPARFSLAHGGKDGHPYPVPLTVYDQTIRVLKDAVNQAKLGRDEKLSAIRRLDDQARRLESGLPPVDVEELMARERAVSHTYGGMTVVGPAAPSEKPAVKRASRREPAQLSLPLAR